MSSTGRTVAFEVLLAALSDVHGPRPTGAASLADGARWLLDQAFPLLRSANRPNGLLDAAAMMLLPTEDVTATRPDPVRWALWAVTSDLHGRCPSSMRASAARWARIP